MSQAGQVRPQEETSLMQHEEVAVLVQQDEISKISVMGQPLTEEERERRRQASWYDYYRTRQPTYYGAWSQPRRADIAQFQDEPPVLGWWFTYFCMVFFLIVLCVVLLVYYLT
jgi:hypothetical protein